MYFLIATILFANCTKTEYEYVDVEVERIVTNTVTETVQYHTVITLKNIL